MEPWLYSSSTGVTPVALIIAAVFWTWLWGPIGLILSTPLTVCLVVMGRNVPRLSFLSVLLSDEEALTPAEDFYHRLLTINEQDELEFVEAYLKANSAHGALRLCIHSSDHCDRDGLQARATGRRAASAHRAKPS